SRTAEVDEMACRLGVDRFIFAGTMEEAFAKSYTKLDHRHEDKYNRHVIYALAKIAARNGVKIRRTEGGPEILFGTNSHVMGTGDDKDSFLQVCLLKFMRGESITMSSGEQNFDVIHVSDCARAYQAIAESGVSGASYWIGSGKPRTLKEYVS